jgi:hypothetical protein
MWQLVCGIRESKNEIAFGCVTQYCVVAVLHHAHRLPGRTWIKEHRFPWFPVRFDFRHIFRRKRPQGWTNTFYSVHYVQVGYADIDVHVYKRIIRIGRLIVITGPNKAELPIDYVPQAGGWYPKENAERMKRHYRRERSVEQIAELYGSKLE